MRAELRAWLGERLGLPPNEVPLLHARSGRLELSPPYNDWSLSVSSRRELGLIAISPPGQGAIGVDVEWLDPAFDFTVLLPPLLTAPERAVLDTVPTLSRREAFFRLWTRKEAVAKALGLGVAAFDAGLDLSALPPTNVSGWRAVSTLGHNCRVRDLVVSPKYVAAVAQLHP
jgi:4'-phosphopantetheinyl transferase